MENIPTAIKTNNAVHFAQLDYNYNNDEDDEMPPVISDDEYDSSSEDEEDSDNDDDSVNEDNEKGKENDRHEDGGRSKTLMDDNVESGFTYLKCWYTNAEFLTNKFPEFKTKINTAQPDIIAIVETGTQNKPEEKHYFPDLALQLEGYDLYRKDNTTAIKGGIIVYIKNTINIEVRYPQAKKINNMISEFKECLLLELTYKKENILFGTFYRKGSSNVANNTLLREIIEESAKKHQKLLFCGDFNFPKIRWDTLTVDDTPYSQTMRFYNCLEDNFLKQHTKNFTRVRGKDKPSMIDLIITEDNQSQSAPEIDPPLGKSDHAVLQWKYLVSEANDNTEETKEEQPFYLYRKGDYDSLRTLCEDTNWDSILSSDMNVDDMLHEFQTKVQEHIEITIPKGTGKRNKNLKEPWMTKSARKAINKKHYAWLRWTDSPSHRLYSQYIQERNRTTKKIRKAKKWYERKIAKLSKANPKLFYKYCNFKGKKKLNHIRLYKDSTKTSIASDELTNANILNDFFSTVYTEEIDAPELILNAATKWLYGEESEEPFSFMGVSPETLFEDVTVSEEEILGLLEELDVTKSTVSSCIHPQILKEAAKELAYPLSIIFNKSLATATVPQSWKKGNVSPIYKSEDRHYPKNYRPITITSVLCRLLEKIVKKHLMKHLADNKSIPKEQHGFVPNRSCFTNLLDTMDNISKLQDMGIPVDEVFLDFSKAFDKVPHQRLIYKLNALGIRGPILNWIESFLSQRTQRVKIRNTYSRSSSVISGVPQGSCLGPCLFLAFVCDLPFLVKALLEIFADDSKLIKGIPNLNEADSLQDDLNALTSWCKEWGMLFNVDKCQIMHYGRNNPRFLYHINGTLLSETTTYKDLGVHVSNDMKVMHHIDICVAKANAVLGMIKRTFSYIDKDIFLMTYKTFVRPILEYCQELWSPYLAKDIDKIERVQRRATKLVPEIKELSYEERLKSLDLFTLAHRRTRGDMISMYKIMSGLYDIEPTDFFKPNVTKTRGHKFKLYPTTSNTEIRRNFFTQRVIVPWNKIPESVILSTTVSTFKRNYDNYIKNKK